MTPLCVNPDDMGHTPDCPQGVTRCPRCACPVHDLEQHQPVCTGPSPMCEHGFTDWHHEADEGTVCCVCGQEWTCQGYNNQLADEATLAGLSAEIEARTHPPHLDGDYREGMFRGLVLARHILGGPCDPGECGSHERDLLTHVTEKAGTGAAD